MYGFFFTKNTILKIWSIFDLIIDSQIEDDPFQAPPGVLVRATATMGDLLRPKVPGHESLIRVADPRPLTPGWHFEGNVID